MAHFFYKVPLVLSPQAEGGYTVTSPVLPELVTEGEDFSEAMKNVQDALVAVLEIYQDSGKPFPVKLRKDLCSEPIHMEYFVAGQ
ncbi:MAG: type II toxin-antitoxin system HicB family antitoxin [Desulfotomaculum sp.]|nr:type II toxin-antitoxin system HicB family antitoxin [Desulfotomaculum sp.]